MKIYLIGYYDFATDSSDASSIVKATTSYEAARQYVLDAIERFKKTATGIHDIRSYEDEAKYSWCLEYKLDESNESFEHAYRIEEVELNDKEDVPGICRPALEKRCEALEKHNNALKSEVAELRKNNSAAQCYLTFWDGGKYEDLDHVLENVHMARHILEGNAKGNTYILKLYEGWKNDHKPLLRRLVESLISMFKATED